MTTDKAVAGFGALAQPTRLEVIKILVQAGPAGLPAGDIAAEAGVAASTLSFHLKELQRAELVTSDRHGRQIVYNANYHGIQWLLRYLMEDCCQQNPTVCAPLIDIAPKAAE